MVSASHVFAERGPGIGPFRGMMKLTDSLCVRVAPSLRQRLARLVPRFIGGKESVLVREALQLGILQLELQAKERGR
jgi:hypothetical protein